MARQYYSANRGKVSGEMKCYYERTADVRKEADKEAYASNPEPKVKSRYASNPEPKRMIWIVPALVGDIHVCQYAHTVVC